MHYLNSFWNTIQQSIESYIQIKRIEVFTCNKLYLSMKKHRKYFLGQIIMATYKLVSCMLNEDGNYIENFKSFS